MVSSWPERRRRAAATAACAAFAVITVLPHAVLPGGAGRAVAGESDYPRGKISGYVFGDYYYNVTGDPEHRYDASGADSANANISGTYPTGGPPKLIGRDLNGVQIRRIYFQHDGELSPKVSTRLRLEADSKSLTSDGKIGVNIKGAYIQMKDVIARGNVLFGVVGTPTWAVSEPMYGYRSIEKTITDFRGIGGSTDLGFQMQGDADAGRKIGYNLMLGNGLGQKPENNRYKKVYASLPLRPSEQVTVEPYADYEWVPGGADKATYKIFAGYEHGHTALGGELVDRVNHKPGAGNQEPFGISLFGRFAAHPQATLFARYDRWQPDTRAADRIDSDLYIAGVDWMPVKGVHVMPNVEATQYRARGVAVAPPHHDVQARVTFHYVFAGP